MFTKNQLGFLYMFMSVCAFSFMDLIVKWSEDYPLGQVLFFRGFFGVVIYFFIMPRERIKNFYYTKRAGLHFLRCIFGLIALIAIFIALRNLPLATVVSISFAAPIFTTIFSIFFLSEKVGLYRWLAVLIGFIGIIIITEPVWLIALNFSIVITLASLFTIPFGWVMPSVQDLILLSMIGFLGGFANLWLSQSFKLSEVSLVSPLKYLALVFGIIFGYLIWDEIPTIKTLIGALLVVASSLIILRREIYHKKEIPSTNRHE